MKSRRFDYVRPSSLQEALTLLAQSDGEAKLIAGGQSLVPLMAFRMTSASLLIDIARLTDLARIELTPQGVRLGALVRWRDIERDAGLAAAHPLLVRAVEHVAHYQIRNRGTVGGSCAHADPAAELPGITVVCDAEFDVASVRGTRVVPAAEFFQGPLTTALESDEMITAIRLPPWPAGRRFAFQEFARRRGDFAIVGVAAFYDTDAEGSCIDPHVGVIGVGDVPVRLAEVEAAMQGRPLTRGVIDEVAGIAGRVVDAQTDIHASADYRRALATVLLERALIEAAQLSSERAA
jgi:carbon-monoxide dehydrogenase medium subunit